MATTQAILFNARYHTELIQSLDLLSNVPDALREQVQLIQDLEKQIKDGKEELEKMSVTTAEKRKIHEGVRDSMVMKTANTLVGRKVCTWIIHCNHSSVHRILCYYVICIDHGVL
jgi:hypothetical protein